MAKFPDAGNGEFLDSFTETAARYERTPDSTGVYRQAAQQYRDARWDAWKGQTKALVAKTRRAADGSTTRGKRGK